MSELRATNYGAITFNCYGTLIDWESGLLHYLQPFLEGHDVHVIDDWALEYFAELEATAQTLGGGYRDVLSRVMTGFGKRLAFTPTEDDLTGMADSMEYWLPFPETVEVLQRLAPRFELGILSNVDNETIGWSERHLKVAFQAVVTAGSVGAYKPDRALFDEAARRLAGPILHVAESPHHDLLPAQALGWDTVWIKRPGSRARKEIAAEPTWTFASLTEFEAAIQ